MVDRGKEEAQRGGDSRPIVGITMGDPTGVGPEVIVKALTDPEIRKALRPIVFGDKNVIAMTVEMLGIDVKVQEVTNIARAKISDEIVHVRSISNLKLSRLKPGRPDRNCGRAMVNYIREATRAALRGEIHSITTAPINKEIMNEVGFRYSGHTELMANLTNARDYAMMFASNNLKVSLVTTHVPLRSVAAKITPGRIYKVGVLTYRALMDYFGITKPKIAVCSINPHAGEGGLFGDEEKEFIYPAVLSLQSIGIDAEGPLPSDTVFWQAVKGRFDAVIAMYHDQALIPMKLLHFKDAVNVTIGLPIIRTSVDHGTAYDIAGKGITDPTSMKSALLMAARMAKIKAQREPAPLVIEPMKPGYRRGRRKEFA